MTKSLPVIPAVSAPRPQWLSRLRVPLGQDDRVWLKLVGKGGVREPPKTHTEPFQSLAMNVLLVRALAGCG